MQAMSARAAAADVRPMKSLMPANRIFYLDTLRVVLTILVIVHHIGQAYGPTGGYWPVQEPTRAAILGPFFTVNRSFFMSLFFLISGYFMVGAYQRNGFARFLRNRLVRLGVPVLAFAALMIPARIFLFHENITRWDDYVNAGHLWRLGRGTQPTFSDRQVSDRTDNGLVAAGLSMNGLRRVAKPKPLIVSGQK